jgi:hypothetical protein
MRPSSALPTSEAQQPADRQRQPVDKHFDKHCSAVVADPHPVAALDVGDPVLEAARRR